MFVFAAEYSVSCMSNHFYFVCVPVFRSVVKLCFVMYLAIVYVIVKLLLDKCIDQCLIRPRGLWAPTLVLDT